MAQSHYTSLVTTLSGLVGGLGKAITYKPILASISLTGVATVAAYAAVSATVGYMVKCGMDHLSADMRHRKNRRKGR